MMGNQGTSIMIYGLQRISKKNKPRINKFRLPLKENEMKKETYSKMPQLPSTRNN